MSSKLTRRQLFVGAGRFGVAYAAFEVARKGVGLVDQKLTWDEASEPNPQFLARNASRLDDVRLGGSFAPEQWSRREWAQREALTGIDLALKDLNLKQMRLGIRWNRVFQGDGRVNLGVYSSLIRKSIDQGADITLNVGPIRVFRWPEDHVPNGVLSALSEVPARGSTIQPGMPLANASLEYLDRLIDTLQRDYSASDLSAIRTIQVENEPFYLMGENEWLLAPAHIKTVAHRVHAAFPEADILLTSAGRLNMNAVRDIFVDLMAEDPTLRGKLISGFDFHYRTPSRDSYPLVRHFDQITYARPLIAGTNDNILDSRQVGYRIEVTEGQMEPYGHFEQPGNLVRDLRYMLQRVFDHVLDPQAPGLVRLWGVEELVKKMISGDLTDEHRQIIELIQAINDQTRVEAAGVP